MNNDPQNRRRDPLMGQTPVQQPIPPADDGYYGAEGDASSLPPAGWQQGGYHMEDQPCDDENAWVLNDDADDVLEPPEDDLPLVPKDLDVDLVGEQQKKEEQSRDAFWAGMSGKSRAVPADPRPQAGQTEAGTPGAESQAQPPVSGPLPPVHPQAGKKVLLTVLIIIAVIIGGALIGVRAYLRIDTVQIEGCSSFTEAQIR